MQNYRAFSSSAILDDAALARRAPSIFSTDRHERTSGRYTYIPTIRVVEGLRQEGWLPTLATEQRVRDESRQGFQKHLLRFRHVDQCRPEVGDEIPEIVLINSHDGSSSYRVMAGFFRLVCSNGMVVASETIEDQTIRHNGDVVGEVIEGVYRIVEDLPRVAAQIQQLKALPLTLPEQRLFGQAAMGLRWDNPADSGFTPEDVIRPRRSDDADPSLWATFNRIQENLIRGGIHGVRYDAQGRRRNTTAREVKGIDQGVKLNQALWRLTEEMRRLKSDD